MPDLPDGVVTFLFSDVEGSTRLLERDPIAAGTALARHHELFAASVANAGGVIFETVGDAVYAAFTRPSDAVTAALEVQLAMAAEDWAEAGRMTVRISVHAGPVERRGDHYFGPALFRAARLQALAWGGQTVLSGVTATMLDGALPDGAGLRDLGSHRLKDLTEPERVYQLTHRGLRSDFPALRSLDAHPHNLPVQLSSLIGRDREVSAVAGLLGAHRLVTLLGPGGIGKTRLALQVAAERVEAHPDGAFFVDLAPLQDPELVPGAIADAMGLAERADQRLFDTLVEHLRPRDVLLVLDNLEQLQPAAADTVADLLREAPRVRVLATSRLPLGIRGEQEHAVPPLDVGAPDRLDAEPPAAVALFLERARAAGAHLAVTAETGPLIAAICRRLDGLPLAIELATSRLRVFGLEQLHDRLAQSLPLLADDGVQAPERHRTLRRTIQWSTELLPDAQRALFARLAVFPGGFTIEAAEAVAGHDLPRHADLAMELDVLVRHSLVRRPSVMDTEPRFHLLETIREYAGELLADGDAEEATWERHASHLLEVVTPAFAMPASDARGLVYARIEAELDNLRAILDWLQGTGRSDLMIQLVAMLGQFVVDRGPVGEGKAWIARALSAAPDGDPLARARVLRYAWSLSFMSGDPAAAESAIDEAIRLFDEIGAERELGHALVRRGNAAEAAGHVESARADLLRAADIAQRHGDDVTRRRALVSLAQIFTDEGDAPAAERALTDVYEDARRADDLMSLLIAGTDLASTRIMLGRAADAVAPAREAVAAGQRAGRLDPLPVANLGHALVLSGDHAEGRRLLIEALDVINSTGDQADLPALLSAWASLEARDGDPSVSAWCHAAASHQADEAGYARRDAEREFEEAEFAVARARMEPSAWSDAWDRGSAASPEEAATLLRERASASRRRP